MMLRREANLQRRRSARIALLSSIWARPWRHARVGYPEKSIRMNCFGESRLPTIWTGAIVPMIYAPKEALIWWIDYIDSVSEAALTASLERSAQGLPGLTLAECHLHAMLKFAEHPAAYKRQRKTAGQPLSDAEDTQIRDAFSQHLPTHVPHD
jgi:hypothetical protein